MKSYEISYNNKNVGKVQLFKNNLNKDFNNSLIVSNNNIQYNIINYNTEMQKYEVSFNINDIDDIYDIVSKYKYNEVDIFNEIDNIKEYNNLRNVKKNTEIKIVISEVYLNNLNIDKRNVDKESLFKSKIYFLKKVLENNNDEKVLNELKSIVNEYKLFKSSNEYEFTTDIERDNKLNYALNSVDKIIKNMEEKSKYKYAKDYIVPIKIDNY